MEDVFSDRRPVLIARELRRMIGERGLALKSARKLTYLQKSQRPRRLSAKGQGLVRRRRKLTRGISSVSRVEMTTLGTL